jgi:transglutaminase-like putative cysteine protease
MAKAILRIPMAAMGWLCLLVSAQAQQAITLAQSPARLALWTRRIDVSPDGSWTQIAHMETKILQPNAIPVLGQTAIAYSDELQQMEIVGAYTRKANGDKIPVAPDAIITRQSPASANSPLLSDQKQKVIIFPNVEVGDTLVYDAKTTSRSLIAGQFAYDTIFSTALLIDDSTLTVSVPKTLPLYVDAHGLTAAKTANGDRTVYTIHYTNANPTIPGQAQSSFDLAPRLSLSTFKDYDAFAASYATMALPAIAVTPAIQAKADEITAGIPNRRDQARRIYNWVAGHIRYVALEFGQGGIVPHAADRVLANAYGDCKDHAVLFAALLKAKGIDSNLVLINSGNAFTAAKVAALSPFNHMITWIPDFHLYADTTNGRFVSFGLLPMSEYGKPVVHIGDKSGAAYATPATDSVSSSTAYKLTIGTNEAGRVVSNSSLAATGDFATALRLVGGLMQGQDGAKMANSILQKTGTPDASGVLMAPPPNADLPSYEISANYSMPGEAAGLDNGSGVALSDRLRIASPFSSGFFGPLIDGRGRDEAAVSCYTGQATDDETLQIPASRHLATLPAETKISKPHLTYISRWSSDGNSVSVHRELTTHFDAMLCSGGDKDDLLAAGDQIRADGKTLLLLPLVSNAPANPAVIKP